MIVLYSSSTPVTEHITGEYLSGLLGHAETHTHTYILIPTNTLSHTHRPTSPPACLCHTRLVLLEAGLEKGGGETVSMGVCDSQWHLKVTHITNTLTVLMPP